MSFLLAEIYDKIKELVRGTISRDAQQKILDLGCGRRGNFWGFYPENYYGIDSDDKVIEQLSKRKDGVYAKHDLCQGLPYGDKSFGYIVSVSFFHHIDDEAASGLAMEMKRVLSPQGRVFIVDGVYPRSKWNIPGRLLRALDRGKYVRSESEFRSLFINGFNIEKNLYLRQGIFTYSVLVMRAQNG